MKKKKQYQQTGDALLVTLSMILMSAIGLIFVEQLYEVMIYMIIFLTLLFGILLTKYFAEYINEKDYE
jgi:hypothetical protein